MAIYTRTERNIARVRATDDIGPINVSTSVVRTSTYTKVGVGVPQWKRKISLLTSAGSSYGVTSVQNGISNGSLVGSRIRKSGPLRGKVGTTVWTGALHEAGTSAPTVPTLPPTTNVTSDARVSFVRKVRKTRTSFQTGVFLGELRETLSMIRRPALAIRHRFSAYSRDAKKAARKAGYRPGSSNAGRGNHAVSETWLEYSFGWRPLFNDVDGAMKALASKRLTYPAREFASAKDQYTGPQIKGTASISGDNVNRIECLYKPHYEVSSRIVGVVAWESTNLAPSWRSQWGLELREFAPTVWELIPYSFLIDYFSNVGNVIEAASTGIVSLRWGSMTTVAKAFLISSFRAYQLDTALYAPYNVSLQLPSPKIGRFSLTRGNVSSVDAGLSDLRLRFPFRWNQAANVAALLAARRF